ncbi:MAG: beta-ketoacyl synthase chain length factor [Betaproteobacteria bacterium]
MLSAYIEGVGLLGPGFDSWPAARAVLAGAAPYSPRATVLPLPTALPPSERRRASRAIKVALATGHEAIAAAKLDPATLATVFASSAGDGFNCHEICAALASNDRQLSPTRFHNSVHNAPAGYWGIASGAMASSSVICAYDASFGAGLLEALAQVTAERMRCVLIAYDTDYPEPIRSVRPLPDAFGIALVLAPEVGPTSLLRIVATLTADPPSALEHPILENLRRSIPAARGLPLLVALARSDDANVVIDYLEDTRLRLELKRCR